MNKSQFSFLSAGVVFGFLAGFVVANEMYKGRLQAQGLARAPIAPGATSKRPPGYRPGGGGMGAGTPTGSGSGSPAAPGGEAGAASMEKVQTEIQALKVVITEDPKNVTALTRLGDIYFDVGMFQKATEYYEKSLAERPGDINVRTDLGTALKNIGQPQKAIEQLEATVAADPKHWKGWFNIGIVALYDLGDLDRAQRAFDKVAELNPGSIDMGALRKEIERLRAERAGKGAGL